MGIFPKFSGWTLRKYLSCHHPVIDYIYIYPRPKKCEILKPAECLLGWKFHLDAEAEVPKKILPAEERYGVDHPGHERSL